MIEYEEHNGELFLSPHEHKWQSTHSGPYCYTIGIHYKEHICIECSKKVYFVFDVTPRSLPRLIRIEEIDE